MPRLDPEPEHRISIKEPHVIWTGQAVEANVRTDDLFKTFWPWQTFPALIHS
jgi:hypothetical protein